MPLPRISRRRLLQGTAGAAGLAALGLPIHEARAAKELVVGFIYVGRATTTATTRPTPQGAAAVKKMPGVKVVEEEKVPETVDVQKTMESMINLDGATADLPDLVRLLRPARPEDGQEVSQGRSSCTAAACGPEASTPKNVGSYFGYIDERQYSAGIVAGHTTKTEQARLRRRQADPAGAAQHQRLHARRAPRQPERSPCTVIFTGDWSMPVKEAEATNSLIDQGVDVLTCHVDSPKVIVETAERRGIYVCGYHASQAPLAPQGLPDRRRVELGARSTRDLRARCSRRARRSRNFCAAA